MRWLNVKLVKLRLYPSICTEILVLCWRSSLWMKKILILTPFGVFFLLWEVKTWAEGRHISTQFHARGLQIFIYYQKIYCAAYVISLESKSIFHFQQIHNLDSDVFFTVCLTTVSLVNLFVFCYFGKISSDSFARMPDCLYCKMNWRELPPKLQMYVVLMIRNMQKPIYYYGFSVAVMDLNTFIYVRTNVSRWFSRPNICCLSLSYSGWSSHFIWCLKHSLNRNFRTWSFWNKFHK